MVTHTSVAIMALLKRTMKKNSPLPDHPSPHAIIPEATQ